MKKTDTPIAKIRSLIHIGQSLAITLPKEFVTKHGLKKGEKIPVVADSIVKIIPMKEIS